MKKETAIAVVSGILAGVLIAVFLIFRTQNKGNANSKQFPSISPAITLPQEKVLSYKIIEPKDIFSTDKDLVEIRGEAPAQTTVVVQSSTSEKLLKTDAATFSTDFPLSLGENAITVTFYNKKDVQEQSLKIYYIENE